MRNASGVLDNTWPSKPAVLMRSPIRRACAVSCWAVGLESVILYKYPADRELKFLGSYHNGAQPVSNPSAAPGHPLRLVDAHVHFYDSDVNRHRFLVEQHTLYEALVGDSSSPPHTHLLPSPLTDSNSSHADHLLS